MPSRRLAANPQERKAYKQQMFKRWLQDLKALCVGAEEEFTPQDVIDLTRALFAHRWRLRNFTDGISASTTPVGTRLMFRKDGLTEEQRMHRQICYGIQSQWKGWAPLVDKYPRIYEIMNKTYAATKRGHHLLKDKDNEKAKQICSMIDHEYQDLIESDPDLCVKDPEESSNEQIQVKDENQESSSSSQALIRFPQNEPAARNSLQDLRANRFIAWLGQLSRNSHSPFDEPTLTCAINTIRTWDNPDDQTLHDKLALMILQNIPISDGFRLAAIAQNNMVPDGRMLKDPRYRNVYQKLQSWVGPVGAGTTAIVEVVDTGGNLTSTIVEGPGQQSGANNRNKDANSTTSKGQPEVELVNSESRQTEANMSAMAPNNTSETVASQRETGHVETLTLAPQVATTTGDNANKPTAAEDPCSDNMEVEKRSAPLDLTQFIHRPKASNTVASPNKATNTNTTRELPGLRRRQATVISVEDGSIPMSKRPRHAGRVRNPQDSANTSTRAASHRSIHTQHQDKSRSSMRAVSRIPSAAPSPAVGSFYTRDPSPWRFAPQQNSTFEADMLRTTVYNLERKVEVITHHLSLQAPPRESATGPRLQEPLPGREQRSSTGPSGEERCHSCARRREGVVGSASGGDEARRDTSDRSGLTGEEAGEDMDCE